MSQLPDKRIIAPRRRRRLRAVSLLPTVATLGNLVCGFLAMMCGLLAMREAYFEHAPHVIHPQIAEYFPTYISIGGYLIVLALVFDALDGRLARLTRRTSEFGAQLDSISDVVSF
ncbi:MAG: CDP-alcohol phosphatidyltransferase family protein, partial [Phycisphaerae bacterium]|nr:CDP-alcohol phosphatidyltransferase family protein [Phycisphaerae bacterium]